MKILHLIYDHPSNPWVGGGGAVRVHELSRLLALKGHEITIVSGRYPGAADSTEGNLTFRFLGSDKDYIKSTFSYALKAAWFILRHSSEYDLVVEDFAPWNPVLSFLLSKRPAIIHINHREGKNILKRWGPPGLLFYLIELVYPKRFRNITALSEGTKKKLGLVRTFVLPAGIREEVLSEGSVGEEKDYVLYVGRLQIQNKGLDTLFDAVRLLDEGELKPRLLLAGKGRDEEKLKEMAKGLDAEFLGFVDEHRKLELLRRARVFVLPSRFEGWGIVVLEAAASGRPVLVSDIPELSFATEGGFGVSFRTGDADDLALKLGKLLMDQNARAEMGRKAIEYARGYTWESIAIMYENYLNEVLTGGSASGGTADG